MDASSSDHGTVLHLSLILQLKSATSLTWKPAWPPVKTLSCRSGVRQSSRWGR